MPGFLHPQVWEVWLILGACWNSYVSIEEERQSGASSTERTVTWMYTDILDTLVAIRGHLDPSSVKWLNPPSTSMRRIEIWVAWWLQNCGGVRSTSLTVSDYHGLEHLFRRCSSAPSKLGLWLDMLNWLNSQEGKEQRGAGSKDIPPYQDELSIKQSAPDKAAATLYNV